MTALCMNVYKTEDFMNVCKLEAILEKIKDGK